MSIIGSNGKGNIYKLSLLIGLALLININNAAFSEEKPLSTIGDPQIASPFTGNTTQPETKTQPEEAPSPFAPEAKPSPLIHKGLEPQPAQVEEIKGTQQPMAPSLVVDPKNKLGLAYPFVQLEKSKELLKAKNFAGAKVIVKPLSEWLTTLTESHIQLFKKLNGIDTAKNQAQVEKRLALDSALLRDKAYYQLALIYLGEKNEKEAIKYFIEVIKSQPKTELGMKSYEILQQIGFTEKVRLIR